MKKVSFLFAVIFNSIIAFAQQEFPKTWETKMDVENKWHAIKGDLSMVLVGDLYEIAMYDGTNGKQLWKYNFKEKLDVKKIDDWHFYWAMEDEPVEITYEKNKTITTFYLDSKTGVENTKITEDKLKPKYVKTKVRNALGDIDVQSGTVVQLSYLDKFLKNSSTGNTFNFTLTATEGYSWNTSFQMKAVSHLNRVLLSNTVPQIVVTVKIIHDKVLVMGEGMCVFDLKTGKQLWSTTYDMVNAGMTSQEIGRTPLPVADEKAVYLCDFTKGEGLIKKLDINTGAVIWENVKLKGNEIVDELVISGNTLLVKYGGFIRKAKNIYNPNDGTTAYKASFEYEGTSNIKGLDTGNGNLKWDFNALYAESKFDKSQCSILIDNGQLIACSPKSIFYLNPENGASLKTTVLSKEIGAPKSIVTMNENFIVEGSTGLSSFSKSTCTQNYATNTDKALMVEYYPNATIVWTGKEYDEMNEFINIDITSGQIVYKLKDCMYPNFDEMGDQFIRFNGKMMYRYTTK